MRRRVVRVFLATQRPGGPRGHCDGDPGGGAGDRAGGGIQPVAGLDGGGKTLVPGTGDGGRVQYVWYESARDVELDGVEARLRDRGRGEGEERSAGGSGNCADGRGRGRLPGDVYGDGGDERDGRERDPRLLPGQERKRFLGDPPHWGDAFGRERDHYFQGVAGERGEPAGRDQCGRVGRGGGGKL